MAKFTSDIFDSVDEVVRAQENDWGNVKERRERLSIVRRFTNMMSTLTEEEAKKMNRTEITNHGLTYYNMVQQEAQYVSMVSMTNAICEVVVDTDNPEQDAITSLRVSEAVNKFALHRKGKFLNFWRKVAGEVVIQGGVPVTMPEKYGWLPKVRIDMFFPTETDLDAENIPYAFDPVELTLYDLEKYQKSFESRGSRFINGKAVSKLIKKIKEQINDQFKYGPSSESLEVTRSIRDRRLTKERATTITGYWFYEVRTSGADQYVSATLLVDTVSGIDLPNDGSLDRAYMIAHIEKAYANADDWLHNVFVDSEIGGVKNMDSLKGVAEMTYPSNVDIEELFNLVLEGDKMRARPKVRLTNGADPKKVLAWDMMRDTFAPEGVEEMPFKGSSQQLLTPMSFLQQVSAAMSTSHVSNGPQGGELRQQAVERQQNNATLQANRVTEAYNHLESILEIVVYRLLAGPTKPGAEGYRETQCVRNHLKKYGIDGKALAEREYGTFKHIRIRAKRTIGNGDLQQQIATSDWLMTNSSSFSPAVRPTVLRTAVALRTQDPDLAENLVKVPSSIINNQRIVAENEYDTIRRRAALGQVLPTGDTDIDHNHVETHLIDMQAHVATDQFQPWTMLDVLTFAGAVEHVGLHLRNMQENPASAAEAKLYIQNYQQIVQSAQPVVQRVEEDNGSEQSKLSPKEQDEMRLKWAKVELDARKVGMSAADMEQLWKNREARARLSERQQYVREIENARRLELDRKKLEMQSQDTQTK